MVTQVDNSTKRSIDWTLLERHFSSARLERYCEHQSADQAKAIDDYVYNLRLAGAMIPMLHVLEIALRNGIHNRLKTHYDKEDWWCEWINDPNFKNQNDKLTKTTKRLESEKARCTPNKIVAELDFGFWVSFFNEKYQAVLWKPLRQIFTQCPKRQRQRHKISKRLNAVRKLRNRVFHHEPLLWLNPDLEKQHQTGIEVIEWIDPKLKRWLQHHDHLPTMWLDHQWRNRQ